MRIFGRDDAGVMSDQIVGRYQRRLNTHRKFVVHLYLIITTVWR